MGIPKVLKDLLGINEGDDEYAYEVENAEKHDRTSEVEEAPAPARPTFKRERFTAPNAPVEPPVPVSNVIGMASAIGVSQIYMMEPRHFDEMSDAVRALHERKTVVLNMTLMEPDQAQRSVDFVAGATHALGGDLERVGDSIFIFAPSNVQLTTPTSTQESPLPKARSARSTAPAWESDAHVRFARS